MYNSSFAIIEKLMAVKITISPLPAIKIHCLACFFCSVQVVTTKEQQAQQVLI
jgi:hypothetical protein